MLLLCVHAAILQPQLSRRAVLTTAGAAAAGQALGGGSLPVYAAGDDRAALLAAIASGDDAAVVSALASLLPLDPSKQRAAAAPQLDGRWRLLWSQGAEKFSPLLGLPKLIRPESYQLIGDAAAAEFFRALLLFSERRRNATVRYRRYASKSVCIPPSL